MSAGKVWRSGCVCVTLLVFILNGIFMVYGYTPSTSTFEPSTSTTITSSNLLYSKENGLIERKIRETDHCVLFPNDTKCEDYKLPHVDMFLDMLCDMMPHMPSCSLRAMCNDPRHPHLHHNPYCEPFSLYKDTCIQMPRMMGCGNYTSMCSNVSVVRECQTQSLSLPSEGAMSDYITDICDSMPMDDCKQCGLSYDIRIALDCDLLLVYSSLCLSMSGMPQCKVWSELCGVLGSDWPICPSNHSKDESHSYDAPVMRMYFHTGYVDYVLFEDWVPRTMAEYVGTWFAILLLGVIFEGIKALRSIFEERCKTKPTRKLGGLQDSNDMDYHADSAEGWEVHWVPFRFWVDFTRACFVFVEVGIGLLLMLIAMTFNVGLFFAVCAGGFVGSLIFGRFVAVFTPPPSGLCH